MIEYSSAAIVITAQSFNPSVFTETWLATNNVISGESLSGPRIYTPDVVQFQTKDLQVLVTPPRMQVTFKVNEEDFSVEVPLQIAMRCVQLLPHTPYKALGLNFDYFVSQPGGRDFAAYNRALLGTGDYSLLREFGSPDALFGRYFSKDFGEARLRVDIRPVTAGDDEKHLLQFQLNFHYDLAAIAESNRADKTVALLGTWDAARAYAERLIGMGS